MKSPSFRWLGNRNYLSYRMAKKAPSHVILGFGDRLLEFCRVVGLARFSVDGLGPKGPISGNRRFEGVSEGGENCGKLPSRPLFFRVW